MNDILTKTFKAEGAILPFRIVKMGAADGGVIAAVDGAAPCLGISGPMTYANGDRVDVMVSGIGKLKAGGSITRGDYVTASTAGVGLAAAPGVGVNNDVIGEAMVSCVVNDVFDVRIRQMRIQG